MGAFFKKIASKKKLKIEFPNNEIKLDRSEDALAKSREAYLEGRNKKKKLTIITGDNSSSSKEEEEGIEKMDEGAGTLLGAKYLTNSRLTRMQLRDPVLRLQVLTQVKIILDVMSRE